MADEGKDAAHGGHPGRCRCMRMVASRLDDDGGGGMSALWIEDGRTQTGKTLVWPPVLHQPFPLRPMWAHVWAALLVKRCRVTADEGSSGIFLGVGY